MVDMVGMGFDLFVFVMIGCGDCAFLVCVLWV